MDEHGLLTSAFNRLRRRVMPARVELQPAE
jgi:hypothetical protein